MKTAIQTLLEDMKEHKCYSDYFEQTYKNHGDETF
jgi:hypothetical protein